MLKMMNRLLCLMLLKSLRNCLQGIVDLSLSYKRLGSTWLNLVVSYHALCAAIY